MVSPSDFQRELSRAKLLLLSNQKTKFWASAMYRFEWHMDSQCETAFVCHKHVYLGAEFFMGLNIKQRAYLMVHEMMHPLFFHPERMGNRHPGRWNSACDYVINLLIDKLGLERPPVGLYEEAYEGFTPEQVYEMLEEEDGGNPAPNPMPDINKSNLPAPSVKSQIDSILGQASQADPSALAGDDYMARYMEMLNNPPVPWENIYADWMVGSGGIDRSWSNPNRRYLPDLIMPTRYGGRIQRAVQLIDTSGSISNHQFNYILTQVEHSRSLLQIEELILIQFDDAVRAVDILTAGEPISNVKMCGGGGTRLDPAMEKAMEYHPEIVVIISDLWCNPTTVPEFANTCWLCIDHKEATVPYGRLIHVNSFGE